LRGHGRRILHIAAGLRPLETLLSTAPITGIEQSVPKGVSAVTSGCSLHELRLGPGLFDLETHTPRATHTPNASAWARQRQQSKAAAYIYVSPSRRGGGRHRGAGAAAHDVARSSASRRALPPVPRLGGGQIDVAARAPLAGAEPCAASHVERARDAQGVGTPYRNRRPPPCLTCRRRSCCPSLSHSALRPRPRALTLSSPRSPAQPSWLG